MQLLSVCRLWIYSSRVRVSFEEFFCLRYVVLASALEMHIMHYFIIIIIIMTNFKIL